MAGVLGRVFAAVCAGVLLAVNGAWGQTATPAGAAAALGGLAPAPAVPGRADAAPGPEAGLAAFNFARAALEAARRGEGVGTVEVPACLGAVVMIRVDGQVVGRGQAFASGLPGGLSGGVVGGALGGGGA